MENLENRLDLPPFARWLCQERSRRGLSKKALATRSGVAQSTITYLEAGKRSPSREMVKDLAPGLAPDGADPLAVVQIADRGLRAAGFSPFHGDETFLDPREQQILDSAGWSQLTPRHKKMVLDLIEGLSGRLAPDDPPSR